MLLFEVSCHMSCFLFSTETAKFSEVPKILKNIINDVYVKKLAPDGRQVVPNGRLDI